jgi:hypothetical protein
VIEDWKLIDRMGNKENQSIDEVIKKLEEFMKTIAKEGNNESESD